MKQPRIALLVIGDGRDHLRAATLESFATAIGGEPGADYAIPPGIVSVWYIDDRDHELGFGGAIRYGWELLREQGEDFDYVFHLEEDWRFDRPIDLAAMSDLLDCDPRLVQVALRRGPVNAAEAVAGGVVEMWPEEYEDGELFEADSAPLPFLRHGLYFTTNPSLYPRSLIDRLDWPEGAGSEATFTALCLEAGLRFALWGPRAGGPWITHTGHQRTGTGY